MWPDFFIVGAAKAGTTSLYEYLNKTENICMSSVKEPHFFAPNVKPHFLSKIVRSQKEYLELFKECKNSIARGEASPSYLWDCDSPLLISKAVPNAKIIAILRDPISRTLSHYVMNVRNGMEKRRFDEAIFEDYALNEKGWGISNLYIDASLYSDQLMKYIRYFGRDHVHIMIFEEFVNNTEASMLKILDFLNVRSSIHQNFTQKYNSAPPSVPRWPRMSYYEKRILTAIVNHRTMAKLLDGIPWQIKRNIRESLLQRHIRQPIVTEKSMTFMKNIFAEDVKRLESIFKRPLPWAVNE